MTIEEFLAQARSGLRRVVPADLQAELDAGAILVDVRDTAQREAQGEMPGARVIDLTVLEWRMAPSSRWRDEDVTEESRVILVCRQGYSSSLAAYRLQMLGLSEATDLEGGFEAWRRWRQAPG